MKPTKATQEKLDRLSKEFKCTVYFLPEFRTNEKLQKLKIDAEYMWSEKVTDWAKRHGHFEKCRPRTETDLGCCYCPSGSCVLGAGISAWFLRSSRHKHVECLNIIQAPGYSCGSLQWEESVDEIVNFLKSNGLDCSYNPGHMD